MASPNNPKSSAQLIRENSHARYVTFNGRRVANGSTHAKRLAESAREALANKFG